MRVSVLQDLSGALLIQAVTCMDSELRQDVTQLLGEHVPRVVPVSQPGFPASRTEFWASHEAQVAFTLCSRASF